MFLSLWECIQTHSLYPDLRLQLTLPDNLQFQETYYNYGQEVFQSRTLRNIFSGSRSNRNLIESCNSIAPCPFCRRYCQSLSLKICRSAKLIHEVYTWRAHSLLCLGLKYISKAVLSYVLG